MLPFEHETNTVGAASSGFAEEEQEHGLQKCSGWTGSSELFFLVSCSKKKLFFGPQVPACMTVGAGLLGALPFHAWNVAALAPNTRRTGFLVLFWCGAKSRRRGLLNFFFSGGVVD